MEMETERGRESMWITETNIDKKTKLRRKKLDLNVCWRLWAALWKWSSSLTFYDIPLSTIGRCTSLLSLVTVLVRRCISLRPHPVRHEHDTVARALCPDPMWLCTAVNSANRNTKRKPTVTLCEYWKKKCESNYQSKREMEIDKLTSLPMIAMHTAIIVIDFGCGKTRNTQNKLVPLWLQIGT